MQTNRAANVPAAPRDRILDQAVVLFATHGFEAMTMRMLGEAVGLDNSSLYRHFASKSELAHAVLDHVAGDFLKAIGARIDPSRPATLDALEEIAATAGAYFFERQSAARLMLHWVMSVGGDGLGFGVSVPATDMTRPGGQLLGRLSAWLADGARRGALRKHAMPDAVIILFGAILLRPATYGSLLASIEPKRSRSAAARAWEQELRAVVRGAFRAMKPMIAAGPMVESERADVLDALRGFALLGILVSHVPDFSGWAFLAPAQHVATGAFDSAAAMLQDFLIRGKFYSLFSLLFGIGFSVQLESASRRGANFARHFARRLTVLLLIGLVHAAFWYGDILKDYALIGFVLIVLRGSSARKVAWVAAFVFALRLIWPSVVAWLVPALGLMSTSGNANGDFGSLADTFAGADMRAIFVANLALVKLKALQLIYDGTAISILSMFLLGALIGKLRLHRSVPERTLRAVFWISAPIGIIGNAVLTPLHAVTPDFPPTSPWVLENTIYAVAVPAMAVAYASGFAWLWSRGGASALRVFAPTGRTALTTYISQTLILAALFYGVGFGLYGHMGLIEGVILALAIFAVQCVIATAWLRWFQFGPIEWIWRRATYGTPISFARVG